MRVWLKDRTVLNMSTTEAAWLAGFFDGEGSLTKSTGGRNHKYKSWIVSISNTCLESLQFCSKITNAGSICTKDRKNIENRKPAWDWRVNSQRNIVAICEQMLPYLIIKKIKVKQFLEEWTDLK
jgi:hypothetical protein